MSDLRADLIRFLDGAFPNSFTITDLADGIMATIDSSTPGQGDGLRAAFRYGDGHAVTGHDSIPDHTFRPSALATPAPGPGDGLRERLLADVDAAYRERNAVVAALIRVGGYPAEVVMAPDTEGWWIVYAETPAGQVSWHIAPDDMDLFRDWPVAFGSRPSPWDGHDTPEKYRRVAALATPGDPETGEVG